MKQLPEALERVASDLAKSQGRKSSVGKSFFIEGIIKRLIDRGGGIGVITSNDDVFRCLCFYAERYARNRER